jgi:hypothetical protein
VKCIGCKRAGIGQFEFLNEILIEILEPGSAGWFELSLWIMNQDDAELLSRLKYSDVLVYQLLEGTKS